MTFNTLKGRLKKFLEDLRRRIQHGGALASPA